MLISSNHALYVLVLNKVAIVFTLDRVISVEFFEKSLYTIEARGSKKAKHPL